MNTDDYFEELNSKIDKAYMIAGKARAMNLDPENFVEVSKSRNIAERVEAIVGPKGIAEEIKRKTVREIVDEILDGKYPCENKIEQAIRTSLAILTEGVVAAPIEGISKVVIEKNFDNTSYLAVHFAGPIRSAGGTAQGLAVLVACYIQKKLGLEGYRPLDDEVERYVHEIQLYDKRCKPLQYLPSDEDIRKIIKNIAVCIDGDPTEKVEVMAYRNLKRVPSNFIRGGMCLVISEGLGLKAKKLAKKSEEYDIDWKFLNEIGKKKDAVKEEKKEKFMSEIVGGRPIFSFPSSIGGFRLRYGRSRISGIACKSIHPATMFLLDEFIAIGTQLKIEKPGKGAVITPCETIEGPVVKLWDNSVVRVESVEQARSISKEVKEILFLGDLLVSYVDFLQTNTPLLKSGYVEEWYLEELKRSGVDLNISEINKISPAEAVTISIKNNVPLHPKYTYHWENLTLEDVFLIKKFLSSGRLLEGKFYVSFDENKNKKEKKLLEILCTPHEVKSNELIFAEYIPLLFPLGLLDDKFNFAPEEQKENLNTTKIYKEDKENKEDPEINKISQIKIRQKVGAYIGSRMGRPEKAKERKMQPPVHGLFPIGKYGGKERLINKAAENNAISVEISINGKTGKQDINIKDMWNESLKRIGIQSMDVKGVEGLISENKIPERIEKGVLRAKNKVFVFKDGTIRFDATDVPITHFKPKEVFVSIENLKKLGYTKDYKGVLLENEDQILELKCQDVIIPLSGVDYLINVCKFIDDLLLRVYGINPYYNAERKEDLLGHLVIGLAPHTSAGITGRIIGFTDANVCLAHPYWHAAKRRNCDGDEDAVMLFMDALLNFSKSFLPKSRGGQMDAPLVVTTILNPKEVDDEVHKMEVVEKYGLEFYKATLKNTNPSEVNVLTVKNLLETNPYNNLNFTHDNGDINKGVKRTKYVQLKNMNDKVSAQLKIAEKIRAVDEKEVANILINSHFLRDIHGNLRSFSEQSFRCVNCNMIYRRIPLVGKCTKCGGNLILTISEGGIKKYLDTSIKLAEKYDLSNYLKQRLMLLKNNTDSIFQSSKKQKNLSEFM